MKFNSELIDAYLDADLTSMETEELLGQLKTDPDALRALVEATLFEEQLRSEIRASHMQPAAASFGGNLRAPQANTSSPQSEFAAKKTFLPQKLGVSWNAALAGLLLGLLSASLVFGYVSSLHSKGAPLLIEGFEQINSPAPHGMPLTPGTWSGDFVECTEAFANIMPLSGKRMLRFLRADYEGKPPAPGWASSLYQCIDVRAFSADLRSGNHLAHAQAHFRSISFDESKLYVANLQIFALDHPPRSSSTVIFSPASSLPDPEKESNFSRASAQRSLQLRSAVDCWQKLEVDLRIPAETQYLLIALAVSEPSRWKSASDSSTVFFPGQFADEVSVTLVRGHSQPR